VVGHTANGETIKGIGYSDDIGSANRNSVITWTNNTNVVQKVWYVAFAYSPATAGRATILASSNGSSTIFGQAKIGGMVKFGGNPLPAEPANCRPNSTRLSLQITGGDSQSGYALIVDTQAMKGGFLHVDLANPTRLHDLPWIAQNNYPNFALLFRTTTGVGGELAAWRFIQRDIYACVN
jgi:hypothetical protein